MLLGDRGATIHKIERLIVGDDTRSWGPPYLGSDSDSDSDSNSNSNSNKTSSYFLSVNRNKKSLAIDLKSIQGVNLVKELVKKSDVLIHNFKPKSLRSIGLDYDSVSALNPRLVYCAISGFGDTGKMKNKPGYDVAIAGMFGLMSITGEDTPCKVGVAITDIATGMLANSAILAALLERHETGNGSYISTSLMETQLSFLSNVAVSALNTDNVPKMYGSAHESLVPYQSFACRCGNFMVVGCGNDSQFEALGELIPNLGSEKFSTNEKRVENRIGLLKLLRAVFLKRDRSEWLETFRDVKFVVTPVRNVKEAFECEQVKERGGVVTIDSPNGGKFKTPAHPVKFLSGGGGGNFDEVSYKAPPRLGQHTREVLAEELGLSEFAIRELVKIGVVQV